MKSPSICRFCEIADGNIKDIEFDEPFAHSDNFIAIASIGALVEGWSLIIPKDHQVSMRNLYAHPEFIEFVEEVRSKIFDNYGSVIAFEHGANKEGSITACGTDHAHLHLVPFEVSLLPEMQKANLHWVRCHASEIVTIAGDNEYLFYTELGDNSEWQDQSGYLHILKYSKSQYFRRIIAGRINKIDVSDYKLFPHVDTAKRTLMTLTRLVA